MWSGTALGADTCGWPTFRGGLKLQLSPRECATKEELKSLLMAAKTEDLHPHDQLGKLSACRTSEQTTRSPTVKMGIAVAAVEFVGMYMPGLGQARV